MIITLKNKILSTLLSLAITLQPIGATATAPVPTPTTVPTTNSSPDPNSQSFTLSPADRAEFLQNLKTSYWGTVKLNYPGLLESLQSSNDQSQELNWQVSNNTNLIDEHPFFMSTQKWVKVDNTHVANLTEAQSSGRIVFEKKSREIFQIKLADSQYALHIAAPLTPLLETSDYILLVADTDDFFAQKLDGQSPDDQGIFFMNKGDFIAQSLAINQSSNLAIGSPVDLPAILPMGLPVYFFPLPGRWAGVKIAFEWQMRKQYAVYDQEQHPLLIDISDLHKIEELGRMNLHLAQALTLFAHGPEFNGVLNPYPRSTAYFGLFVSGQIPKNNNWATWLTKQILPSAMAETANNTSSTSSKNVTLSRFERIKQSLKAFALPGGITTAQVGAVWYALAGSEASSLIPPDMIHRLLVAGSTIAAAYVGALALKYTLYKKHFAQKYPHIEGESKFQSVWKEIKGQLDIFQHNTYAINQTPTLALFNISDLIIDRWFSKNKFLRVLYDNTIGWMNQNGSSIPVNWRATLFALADGHAASLSAAVSLLVFYPWLFSSMGMSLAAGGGALAAHFISSEFIRIYFEHWRVGAQSYTSTIRISLRTEAQFEADRLLELEGLNPQARASKKLKQKLTEEILNKKMISRGLPDKSDFLYDFKSVMTKGVDFFRAKETDLERINPEALDQDKFSSERSGLLYPALKEALKRAKEIYKQSPAPSGSNVIRAFEWAIKHYKYTSALAHETKDRWKSFSANPASYLVGMSREFVKQVSKSALEHGRDVRKVVWLASTIDTSVNREDVYKNLPESWIKAAGDLNSAYLATDILHHSYHSLYEKNAENLRPSIENIREHSLEARDSLRSHHYDAFEHHARFDHKIIELINHKNEHERLSNYNPLNLNFYELYQYKVGEAAAEPFLHDNKNKIRNEFARAISRQMGLYIKNNEGSDLIQRTEKIANRNTEKTLEAPIEINFLKSLDERERVFYEAWVYTQEFLQTYVSLAKSNEYLEVGSPERPGRLQIVRRALAFAPGYKRFFLPCILTIESIFKNDTTAYQLGLKGWFSRLPLLPDVYESLIRTLRTYPYTVTAGYAINVMFFQSTLTWPQSLLFSSFYAFAVLSVEITNRLVSNFGIEPMKNLSSRLMYTYILSWFLSLRYFPTLAWSEQFDQTVRTNVINPAHNILSEAGTQTSQALSPSVEAIFNSCAKLLGGG